MLAIRRFLQDLLETYIKGALVGLVWRVSLWGATSRDFLRRLGFVLLPVHKVGAVVGKAEPTLYREEPETRIPQADGIGKTEVEVGMFPSIGFYRLQNSLVTANRRLTSVISSNRFLISDSADPGPWNLRIGPPTVGGVLRNSDKYVMVKLSVANGDPIRRGILGGTTSPHNWYSWLFDVLPTVWLAKKLPREFRNWPMLLPAGGLRKADWLEALNVLEPGREVLAIAPDQYIPVEDLLWLEAPNCPGPLPVKNDSSARFRIHLSAYRDYKNDFDILCSRKISESGTRRRQFPERVFLARNPGGQRPYNQDEAICVAKEFDFEPVMLESLNFIETFELFQGASRMVGPHGAGWTNMIFCRPGAKGLMWTWAESMVDNWYANVAKVAEVNFSVFVGSADNSKQNHVDLDQLRSRLGALG